jgi:cytochrome c biogenesis protein CcmG, thiol:disulfide interchange protein DsbE
MFSRRRSALITLSVLALLLPLPACRQKASAPAVPGNPAPAFMLRDTDGRTVRLSDHAGKVVVLDFWATWCGPCREAAGELKELQKNYGSRGVVIIGISVDKGSDAGAKVREFARQHGITYLLLIDDESSFRSYGIARVPATFVLDRQHIVRAAYPGYQPGIGKLIAVDIEQLL